VEASVDPFPSLPISRSYPRNSPVMEWNRHGCIMTSAGEECLNNIRSGTELRSLGVRRPWHAGPSGAPGVAAQRPVGPRDRQALAIMAVMDLAERLVIDHDRLRRGHPSPPFRPGTSARPAGSSQKNLYLCRRAWKRACGTQELARDATYKLPFRRRRQAAGIAPLSRLATRRRCRGGAHMGDAPRNRRD